MKRWGSYVLITTLTAGLTGGSIAWGQPIPAPAPAPAAKAVPASTKPVGAKVNINTADKAGLMSLKGIGDKLLSKLKDQITVE